MTSAIPLAKLGALSLFTKLFCIYVEATRRSNGAAEALLHACGSTLTAREMNSSGGGYIVGGMPSIPEMSGDSLKKMQMEALRKNAISQSVPLSICSRSECR